MVFMEKLKMVHFDSSSYDEERVELYNNVAYGSTILDGDGKRIKRVKADLKKTRILKSLVSLAIDGALLIADTAHAMEIGTQNICKRVVESGVLVLDNSDSSIVGDDYIEKVCKNGEEVGFYCDEMAVALRSLKGIPFEKFQDTSFLGRQGCKFFNYESLIQTKGRGRK